MQERSTRRPGRAHARTTTRANARCRREPDADTDSRFTVGRRTLGKQGAASEGAPGCFLPTIQPHEQLVERNRGGRNSLSRPCERSTPHDSVTGNPRGSPRIPPLQLIAQVEGVERTPQLPKCHEIQGLNQCLTPVCLQSVCAVTPISSILFWHDPDVGEGRRGYAQHSSNLDAGRCRPTRDSPLRDPYGARIASPHAPSHNVVSNACNGLYFWPASLD